MEDVCKRFPIIAGKIFRNLRNQDLIKCKLRSREICSFLNDERFFAIRVINSYFGNFVEFQDLWISVIAKAPSEIVKKLSQNVQKYFIEDESRFEKQWPPFWIAAENNSKELCKYILDLFGENFSLKGAFGLHASLFMVAKKGHTEICKLIVDRLEDKNPSDNIGWTPLHEAAGNGQIEICKILMNNLENKNPGRVP